MRILITTLLLCISAVLFAQVPTSFQGTLNIYQSSGASPNYEIRGIFNDTQGRYTADSADVGDKIFILDGADCVELEITSIISTSGGILRCNVTDVDAVLVNPPLATGAIMEPTPNYGFPTFVDGISNDLLACIRTHFTLLVDNISSGGITGVPGNTQDTVVQVGHGLSLLDPVFVNASGNWILSNISDEDSCHMAIVTEVISADTLILTYNGLTQQPSHGYTVGGVYFVQDDGTYATTVPTNFINDIAFYVVSDSTLYITEQRPVSPMTDLNGIYTSSDTIPSGTIATAGNFQFRGENNNNYYISFNPENDVILMRGDSVLLSLGIDGAVITDSNASKRGLEYAASGYVTQPLSLTTKEYVDSMITTVEIPDGDKGDIVVSGSGTVWDIDTDAVGSNEIATSAVTTTEILDGTILTTDLAFTVNGGSGAANQVTYWTATNTLAGNNNFQFDGTNAAIGTSPAASNRLVVRGEGTTSATNALSVQNSSGSSIFQVRNDGAVSVNNTVYVESLNSKGIAVYTNGGASAFRVRSADGMSSLGNISPDGSTRFRLMGSGATGSTTTFDVFNSSSTRLFRVLDNGEVAVPIRTGTATNLAGWTSGDVAANVTVGTTLSLSSGTLNSSKREFYVASTGNNSNDGRTPATAWQTIAAINTATLQAGDIVYLKGDETFSGVELQITESGTAGAPITITSYGGGTATISVSSGAQAVSLTNSDYITLDNLNIVNTGTSEYGILLLISAGGTSHEQNITIKNCKASGFVKQGLLGYSDNALYGFVNVLIEDCEFFGNGDGIFIYPSLGAINATKRNTNITIRRVKAYNNKGNTALTTSHSGSGIVLAGATNSTIEYCEAFGNGANNSWSGGGPFGIWIWECDNVTIQHCESHHNTTGTGANNNDGGGFDIDGGCSNSIIQYCYSHDNTGPGYAMFQFSGGATYTTNRIRYNVSVNDARGGANQGALSFYTPSSNANAQYVHNNVFFVDGKSLQSSKPSTISFTTGSSTFTALEARNNIFYAKDTTASIAYLGVAAFGTWSNNYYHTDNGASANYSTGGTVGDPMLRNPGWSNTVGLKNFPLAPYLDAYNLITTSPCINAGATIATPTLDFFNTTTPLSTRDIGIAEYAAVGADSLHTEDAAITGTQTLSNTSDATTHTVTLSDGGGSFQLVEGSGVTLTTTGTGSDGIITIAASGATGEANTASNLGAGAGVFEGKVSLDLQFNSLVSESTSQLTIAEDDPNNTIDFTINTGAVSNGVATLTTGDQVYDFVTAQGNIYTKSDTIPEDRTVTIGSDFLFKIQASDAYSSTGRFDFGTLSLDDKFGFDLYEANGTSSGRINSYYDIGTTGKNQLTIENLNNTQLSRFLMTNDGFEEDLTILNKNGADTSLIKMNTTGTTIQDDVGMSINTPNIEFNVSGFDVIASTSTVFTTPSTQFTGTLRFDTNGSSATSLAGQDNTNRLTAVTLGYGLDLTSGTLLVDSLEYATQYDLSLVSGTTNLTFSGASSPVTLNSSSGSDVTFTAGSGIGLSATGTDITITNSGDTNAADDITGAVASGQVVYGTGANTVASEGAFTYTEASDKLSLGNANTTWDLTVDKDATDTGIGIVGHSATATQRPVLALARTRGTEASKTTIANGDLIGSITGNGYDGSGYQTTGRIDFKADAAVSAGVVPMSIHLMTGTTEANRTERLSIESGGEIGIGTTAPTSALHMVGNQNSSYQLFIENNSTGTAGSSAVVFENSVVGDQAQFFKTGTGYTTYKNIVARDFGIYNATTAGNMVFLNDFASGEIKFATGGSSTSQMVIQSDGDVGIGNTSPGADLDVTGTFRVSSRSGTADRVAGWANATGQSTDLTLASGLSISGGALTPADASATNELQTVNNTSDATSHTVTLSNSGGSIQLVEGSNITLTTTGTAGDGIVTIASTGGGATNLTFTGASSPYTLNSDTGTDVTFTEGEGIDILRSSNDLTISVPVMTAATGGGAGAVGIVPQPSAGENIEFLRGDATWAAVEYSKNATIESPGSSENVTLFYTRKAITIREVADVVRGSTPSVTWQVKYATTRDSGSPTDLFSASRTTTSTSGATTTTFNDATIGAGNWIWLVTSATSGTNDELSVTLTYTID